MGEGERKRSEKEKTSTASSETKLSIVTVYEDLETCRNFKYRRCGIWRIIRRHHAFALSAAKQKGKRKISAEKGKTIHAGIFLSIRVEVGKNAGK